MCLLGMGYCMYVSVREEWYVCGCHIMFKLCWLGCCFHNYREKFVLVHLPCTIQPMYSIIQHNTLAQGRSIYLLRTRYSGRHV